MLEEEDVVGGGWWGRGSRMRLMWPHVCAPLHNKGWKKLEIIHSCFMYPLTVRLIL